MQTAPAGGGDATGTGGGDATGTGGGDATGTGGGDATTAGGGLDTDSVPVSRNGDSTLPTLPLTLNTSVSVSVAVALPVKKVKLSVSPALSAYVVIWNSALPAYGPKGGDEGVSCKPRTAVPTYTVSVPDDCGVVPSVTKAVTAIVFAKSLGLKLCSRRLGVDRCALTGARHHTQPAPGKSTEAASLEQCSGETT